MATKAKLTADDLWHTVSVYRVDGSTRLLRDREFLEGEDVLPGLKIALSELFE